MIDFVKIVLKDYNPAQLEVNPLLDFYDNINLKTGEIKTTNRKGQKITPFKNALYKDLEFKIYDTGTLTIAGSLHKYKNKGGHNYDDFNIKAITDVLKEFQRKFHINPTQSVLKSLELGINIIPPIPTNDILQYCFLHKTTPFEYKYNSDKGKYLQAEHSQYIIKLYNKSLHYKKLGVKDEIMRFEIKYKKMEKLNERGIFSLEDLMQYGLHNFKKDLLKEWENVFFYDRTITCSTPLQQNYNNPLYWINLLKNKSRSTYYKHRNKLKEVTKENSENIQEQITRIMSTKIDFLTGRGTRIDSLYIGSISTPQNKPITAEINNICQVTGLNISMQKDSTTLSHTGLKYFYKTDRKTYDEVKRKYLSEHWQNSDHKIQIKKIAHNIRNRRNNQKIKQKKLYMPEQPLLFDLSQLPKERFYDSQRKG